MGNEQKYFVGGTTVRFPRKINVVHALHQSNGKQSLQLLAHMSISDLTKHIKLYEKGQKLPCGELMPASENDRIYAWFERHPGSFLSCCTTGKPEPDASNIGSYGFYVTVDFSQQDTPLNPRRQVITAARLRQMLFEALQLLRKTATDKYSHPIEWKDVDDWLFSELDIEIGELEAVYADTGVIIYGGSCYEDGQSPKDYATKFFEAAPGSPVAQTDKSPQLFSTAIKELEEQLRITIIAQAIAESGALPQSGIPDAVDTATLLAGKLSDAIADSGTWLNAEEGAYAIADLLSKYTTEELLLLPDASYLSEIEDFAQASIEAAQENMKSNRA